ncbi:CHAT domain-containing protein [Nonomuraea wenchangensis]
MTALVHLACHALSDPEGLTGGLVLTGGEPLAVADIVRLNVAGGRMAFLSACGAAQGSVTILDQAIHVCSAFQLAGYSDVVGTLWPVADGVAYALTEDVHTRLSFRGQPVPPCSTVPLQSTRAASMQTSSSTWPLPRRSRMQSIIASGSSW